jgi:hypothetical protein
MVGADGTIDDAETRRQITDVLRCLVRSAQEPAVDPSV